MKYSAIALLLSAALSQQAQAADNSTLSGVLQDSEGKPLANVEVFISSHNQSATTDENGRFEFSDLETGRYVLDIKGGKQGHINKAVQHTGESLTVTVDYSDTQTLVITGNPLEHTILEMAAPAVIVSGDELTQKRGINIGETLAEVPGVNLSSFGAGAGRPVIRGQQGNRVTVLSNNSTTQDASNASPDHWISAEPLLAKRVEILKGPATLLYGGGAVGGAVNVVDNRIPTELPDGIEGGVEVRMGDSATGERSTVGTFSTANGGLAFNIDAFKSETDELEIPGFAESYYLREQEEAEGEAGHDEEASGILENSDTDSEGGSVGFSYITDAGYWGVSYSDYKRNYGLPGHAEHHDEEGEHEEEHGEEAVRLDLHKKRWDMKGRWNTPFDGFKSLNLHFASTDYQHQEIEGAEIGTTFLNDAQETRLELVHDAWSGWQGAFGLQYSDSDFVTLGDEAYIPASNTEKLGLFWLEEYEVGQWHTELGARYDKQTITTDLFGQRDDNAFSFAFGSLLHIDEHWTLPINITRAQRIAAVEELYSNAGNDEANYVPHLATATIEVGNPNLSKETANNIDIGVRYNSDVVSASVAMFHNRINDYIFLAHEEHEPAPGEVHDHEEFPVFKYQQADATFEGAEAEINWTLATDGLAVVRTGLFGDYTVAKLDDGSYLPRIPAKRFGGSIGLDYDMFTSNITAIKVFDQDRLAEDELPTDGYTLINLDLGYNVFFDDSELFLFLRGQNLADAEIRDHASFLKDRAPRAGRSLTAGFRWTF
ncbi:TonB-dependent receptor [Kangiella koreensis]|uniref:TonB-dependent receptor n=1 Tax=Kangiella koreensis (strain DSM 16069 / JCM 12317 / KCTC 12182 / SW-125) TaxID=523791 RepID=C7R9P9_KANKD|nr:TonB-dependent receptor [Kangiella koreensis]ACV27918.1 TonB-dependent receptor [Kangiella koreensis DSM 16069]